MFNQHFINDDRSINTHALKCNYYNNVWLWLWFYCADVKSCAQQLVISGSLYHIGPNLRDVMPYQSHNAIWLTRTSAIVSNIKSTRHSSNHSKYLYDPENFKPLAIFRMVAVCYMFEHAGDQRICSVVPIRESPRCMNRYSQGLSNG